MVGRLVNIVVKEIKDLMRDPKILIGMVLMPLIIFPVMGFAIGTSMEAAVKAAESMSVVVLDFDGGAYAGELIDFLRALSNVNVTLSSERNVTEAALRAVEEGASALLVIPEGYSENITEGVRAHVIVYSLLGSISLSETGKAEAFQRVLSAYERSLVVETIERMAPERDPSTVLDPVDSVEYTVIRNRIIAAPAMALFGVFMGQSVAIPFIVMMLLVFAMQIAATSIAVEKEQKTLETLLSLPIGRLTILAGKLVGSVFVAALGAVSYMIGFTYYLNTAVTGPATFSEMPIGEGLSFSLTPEGMLLIGILLFVTILSGLALAISLAVFAEDVRSAQALVGYLYIPVFIPAFFLMFTDIETLPPAIAYIILAIPYSHPIMAVKSVILGDYHSVVWGIAYISLFTVGVLYVAARLFTTDKILTARLSLRRRR